MRPDFITWMPKVTRKAWPGKMLYALQYLSDFYLLSKLKEFMKECKFANDKDVICAKNGWLEEQDQQFFYSAILALEKYETKCIKVVGDYVKK